MARIVRIDQNKMFRLCKAGRQAWRKSLFMLCCSLLTAPAHAEFIAVSLSSEDNFRNTITESIEQAIDARNDYVYIESVDNDFNAQVKQIRHFIDSGADAVIVFATGTKEQNKQLFEFAKEVPLVFINTEPVDDLFFMPPNTVYVGSNEVDSGTMQMEALAKMANYQGKIALLQGEMSHPAAVTRTQDVYNVADKYPELSVVVAETGNWQRNQGYNIVEKWVKDNVDFDILASNNDEMLLGGIMALHDAGKDVKSYYTGGIDGIHDALLAMQKGDVDVTVLQDGRRQGAVVVDVAYRMIKKGFVVNPRWVPFKLITKENYQTLLDNDK